MWEKWDVKTITKYATGQREKYWLITRALFLKVNNTDDQPDFPFSGKAFVYRCFVIHPDVKKKVDINKMLICFYSERSQPQHLVCSVKRIVDVVEVGTEG